MPETIKPWLTKSQTEKITREEISEGEEEHFNPTKIEDGIEDELELKELYPELIPTEKLLTSEYAKDDIYYSYARAISRRGREPLSQDRFEAHFWGGANFNRPLAFGDEKNGYLLGGVNELGIFTPTHFAPFSLRGGYELFQKLGTSTETPSILAITNDLVETLQKMPSWHNLELPETLLAGFHSGEIFEKKLMYNDYFETPSGRELANKMLDMYREQ